LVNDDIINLKTIKVFEKRHELTRIFTKLFFIFIGQVAFGKKHILITKRGKPMARLVPADESNMHLRDAKGWLEGDDPFFDEIDRIVQDRIKHVPRVLKGTSTE
jgi:prevent-host-death family protein